MILAGKGAGKTCACKIIQEARGFYRGRTLQSPAARPFFGRAKKRARRRTLESPATINCPVQLKRLLADGDDGRAALDLMLVDVGVALEE